jgi:hypothetical protein
MIASLQGKTRNTAHNGKKLASSYGLRKSSHPTGIAIIQADEEHSMSRLISRTRPRLGSVGLATDR